MVEHIFSTKFNDHVLNDEVFNRIKDAAHKLHESVNQFYDEMPYGYHLDMAVDFLLRFMPQPISDKVKYELIFGMYFHDSIEDARQTYNDVKKIAKEILPECDATRCAELVYALTNEKGRTRKEREGELYFAGMQHVDFAPLLKICDRMANVEQSYLNKSRMLDVYRKEHEEFMRCIGTRDMTNQMVEMFNKFLKEE